MVTMKIKVTISGKTYEVDIQDLNARPVLAEVDGQVVEVFPEEDQTTAVATSVVTEPNAPKLPKPVQSAPRAVASTPAAGASILKAPLPGTIVSIDVKPGQSVKKGDLLLTLEAMKMKNAIRSDVDGVIADVHVNQGDLVKHGQALVSFKG
jgi:biotin carboxyl carrier protein